MYKTIFTNDEGGGKFLSEMLYEQIEMDENGKNSIQRSKRLDFCPLSMFFFCSRMQMDS